MPKSPDNQLYLLIKSMSPSEKRYFKRVSFHHENEKSNYVKLFDAIEKQSRKPSGEYNEKLLLKEKYVTQLPQLKKRLHEIVLKSLNAFHSGKTVNSQLQNHVQTIEILKEKGLYDACEKMIRNAKSMATRYEKREFLIDLSFKEIEVKQLKSFKNISEDELKALSNKALMEIDIYKNQQEYQHLLIFLQHRATKGLEGAFVKGLKKVIGHSLFSSQEKALSFSARRHFLYTYCTYFYYIRDYVNSYKYTLQLIELMESNPHSIEEDEYNYCTYLYESINLQKQLGLFKDVFSTMEKIRKRKFGSQKNYFVFNCMINNYELAVYRDLGEFDKATSLIKRHEKMLNRSMGFLRKQTKMIFYSGSAEIYVMTGDYASANKCINIILNDVSMNGIRSDIQCGIRIRKLIIYFEKGHQDLLEHAVKSYYRFFKQGEHLTPGNLLILDFFDKTVPRLNSKEELLNACKVLKGKLQVVLKKFWKEDYYDFEFISWLDSKIENKSFAEVMKEKAKTL